MAEKVAKLGQEVVQLKLEKTQLYVFHNDIIVPLAAKMDETAKTLKEVAEIVVHLKTEETKRVGKMQLIKNITVYSVSATTVIGLAALIYKGWMWFKTLAMTVAAH